MRVTVLGCGPSTGVPAVGPDGWGECDPTEPRNHRRRASIVVESGEARLLVDTSPDLRAQLLDSGIWKVDAVLFTHAHADHVNGIDDIRSLNYYGSGALDGWPSGRRSTSCGSVLLTSSSPIAAPRRPSGDPASRRARSPGRSASPASMSCRSARTTATCRRWASASGPSLFDRRRRTTRGGVRRAARRRHLAGGLPLRPAAPDPFAHRAHTRLDRAVAAAPGRVDAYGLPLDYHALCARLPDGVEPAWDGMVIEI